MLLNETWDKDWPRTIQVLRQYRDLYSDYVPAKDKLYDAHLNYAGQLMKEGLIPQALVQLQEGNNILDSSLSAW